METSVGLDQLRVVGGQLAGAVALALEGVDPVVVELGGGHVEGERDVLARGVTGLLDRLDDQVERLAVGRQVGREAALVAEAGAETALLEHLLEGVVGLGAPADGLGERLGADRRDHELLDVDVGVRVGPAVQNVHHRHGQQVRVGAAEVAEQRQVAGLGGGVRHGEGDAEDRVGAQRGLVGGGVQVEHGLVDQALLGGVVADQLGADLLDDREHGLLHALAEVTALVPVAQLQGLEGAGGGPGGDRGAAGAAVVEADLDLDRGIASRVEDLAGYDDVDGRHEVLLWSEWFFRRRLQPSEPNRLREPRRPPARLRPLRPRRRRSSERLGGRLIFLFTR